MPGGAISRQDWAALLLRVVLGGLFIAHLYWKIAVLPGGIPAWWENVGSNGYPAFVRAYVLSVEFAGALLLIPGILVRYVAAYAIPMMIGASQFWLVRNGFYFTASGAELPIIWTFLLFLQIMLGAGHKRLSLSRGVVIRRAPDKLTRTMNDALAAIEKESAL